MAKTFKTDASGKALIKEFEKCELETYFDATSGNPVIGWGQENWLYPNTPGAIRVVPGLKITQQQADDAFEFFIHNVTDPLVWKHFNCETQAEHNACAAWVYNIRTSRLERGEYSLPGIFNKRPRDPQEIVDWWIKYRNPKTNTEQGLYRRRLAELSHMDGAPHKFAWMAKLRRAGEPGNRFGGPIVEITDPNYILDLARAAKPIPQEPDPPKAPAPVIEVKAEPLPEIAPKVDPAKPLKPMEASDTHRGLSKAESGKETAIVGGVLTGLGAMLPNIQAITAYLAQFDGGTILATLSVIGVGVVGVGAWRWWRGRIIAYEGRLRATEAKI